MQRQVGRRLRLQLIALLLSGCATPSKTTALGVGEPMAFTLPDLQGGRFSLSDLAGDVVLVDVWATWCKPCKGSMPFYASLYEKHRASGFSILAVSVDEQEDDLSDYVKKNPLPFVVLRDPEGTLPARAGVSTMPTSFLIGRDGLITWVHVGFEAGDEARISAAVEEALAVMVGPGETPKR